MVAQPDLTANSITATLVNTFNGAELLQLVMSFTCLLESMVPAQERIKRDAATWSCVDDFPHQDNGGDFDNITALPNDDSIQKNSFDLSDVGVAILDGIKDGIKDGINWLIDMIT